jgi:carbonic anhydrase
MHQLDLTPVIGSQNTLVISCVECSIVKPPEGVYVYTCLATALQDQDPSLAESIRYFIEEKACTQVIIAGHLHCHALEYIRLSNSTDATISTIKSYLKDLEAHNNVQLIRPGLRERFITELNIIRQTNLLMHYDFIERKVASGDLSITGVICQEKNNSIQTIFFNGLTVNTLVTMN